MSCFPISTHLFLAACAQAILNTEGPSFFCNHKKQLDSISPMKHTNTYTRYNTNSNITQQQPSLIPLSGADYMNQTTP